MDEAVKQLIRKLNIDKPEVIHQLTVASGDVSDGIYKKLKPKIQEMNEKDIEKNFRIPENIVINESKNLMTVQEQELLECEVNEMSAAVEQNAFFISSLNDELYSYENIEQSIQADTLMIEKIEAQQSNLLDLVVLENTANKLNKS